MGQPGKEEPAGDWENSNVRGDIGKTGCPKSLNGKSVENEETGADRKIDVRSDRSLPPWINQASETRADSRHRSNFRRQETFIYQTEKKAVAFVTEKS